MSMTIRPMDETGDVLPVTSRGDLPTGRESTAMALRCRARLFAGEWFEDDALGLPLRTEQFRSLGREDARRALAAEIATWLSGTAGVAGIRDAEITRDPDDPRTLIFRAAVLTENGESFSFLDGIRFL